VYDDLLSLAFGLDGAGGFGAGSGLLAAGAADSRGMLGGRLPRPASWAGALSTPLESTVITLGAPARYVC
jgi:hypothetical protein